MLVVVEEEQSSLSRKNIRRCRGGTVVVVQDEAIVVFEEEAIVIVEDEPIVIAEGELFVVVQDQQSS